MIKLLRLINWKSFRDATLFVDPLTVIIGLNASGKSNILDALVFLQRISGSVPVTTALAGDMILPPLRGGLEWCCRIPEKHFTLEVTVSPAQHPRIEYTYTITLAINGSSCRVAAEHLKRKDIDRTLFHAPETNVGPALPAYFSTGGKRNHRRIDQNPAYSVLSQVETLHISKPVKDAARIVKEGLQSVFILDPIPSHMRGYSQLSETLSPDASNMAGVLAAFPDAERKVLEETLTSFLRELPERDIQRVWIEKVGKFETDAMLYCEEQWIKGIPQTMDARGMSDGTLRFLAIVTALLTCKEGSLIVVEEVDNGLHPSRADTLVTMLKTLGEKRGVDVAVTTHNPALLDALGPAMLPFVSVVHRGDSGASDITLLEDIKQLPKLLAIGPLGRLVSDGRLEKAIIETQE